MVHPENRDNPPSYPAETPHSLPVDQNMDRQMTIALKVADQTRKSPPRDKCLYGPKAAIRLLGEAGRLELLPGNRCLVDGNSLRSLLGANEEIDTN